MAPPPGPTAGADLVTGADGRPRCGWCGGDADYVAYHDSEWGRPVTGDTALYEKLCLEGFQAGLSWLTILRKRPAFRAAFAGFDPAVVAAFDDDDIVRLLDDEGIIRHRGKITATINNAARANELIADTGSLAAHLWSFAPDGTDRPAPVTLAEMPATTPESEALSRDLRRRGWRFVGPTTAYAFMQAMGLVNDHLADCWARDEVEAERSAADIPPPPPPPPTTSPGRLGTQGIDSISGRLAGRAACWSGGPGGHGPGGGGSLGTQWP